MDSQHDSNSSADPRSKVEGRMEDLGRRLDREVEELVRWLNDEVVVAARSHSGRALRAASEKLARFADQLDDLKRER